MNNLIFSTIGFQSHLYLINFWPALPHCTSNAYVVTVQVKRLPLLGNRNSTHFETNDKNIISLVAGTALNITTTFCPNGIFTNTIPLDMEKMMKFLKRVRNNRLLPRYIPMSEHQFISSGLRNNPIIFFPPNRHIGAEHATGYIRCEWPATLRWFLSLFYVVCDDLL